MTLSSTISKQSYAGDGTTASFPIPFLFLDNDHIEVVLRDGAGAETTWIENTHYTLAGAGAQDGGTLTVATSPTDHTPQPGETLTIRRVVPATQETDYPEGGAFPAAAHETALDKLTMLVQQHAEQFARSLLFPVSDSFGLNGILPPSSQRASKFLAFDGDGFPIAAAGTSADLGPVSSFIATLLDDPDAAVARETLGAAAEVALAAYALLNSAQTWTKGQRGQELMLSDAASIVIDLALANNFSMTLGGNRTLANPTNGVAGQSGVIVVSQDGSGNRTLAYGSSYVFANGIEPALSTAANATDLLFYYVISSSRVFISHARDVKP